MIVFIGYNGSGKTTCAKIMEKEYGYKDYQISSGVKDVARVIFPKIDPELWEGVVNREWREEMFKYGKTPRDILKLIGTDMFRKMLDENIWIERLCDIIGDDIGKISISDCRFTNEMEYIKSRYTNCKFIYVRRNNLITNSNEKYQLESLISKCDFTVDNDGTIEDLKVSLRDVINL